MQSLRTPWELNTETASDESEYDLYAVEISDEISLDYVEFKGSINTYYDEHGEGELLDSSELKLISYEFAEGSKKCSEDEIINAVWELHGHEWDR